MRCMSVLKSTRGRRELVAGKYVPSSPWLQRISSPDVTLIAGSEVLSFGQSVLLLHRLFL